jgi:hypothetical protein
VPEEFELRGLYGCRKQLRERLAEQANRILQGRFVGFDLYQRACGVMEGLQLAESDVEDVILEWERKQ